MVCHGRLPGAATESASFVSSVYVENARVMARALVWSECPLPGEWALARHRVELRYGIAASLLRDLEYRPPKQLPAHQYARIEAAFRVMSERSLGEQWEHANGHREH